MGLSFRTYIIILFIIGVVMCAKGIGRIAANNDWLSPFAIIGYLLGISALTLFISVMMGLKTSYISSDKQALVVLATIIATKIIISLIYIFTKNN